MTWALVGVIALLLVERVLHVRAEVAERKRLVNAVLARSPSEFALLNRVDDLPKPEVAEREPEEQPWGLAP